jgi:hypothetical protein
MNDELQKDISKPVSPSAVADTLAWAANFVARYFQSAFQLEITSRPSGSTLDSATSMRDTAYEMWSRLEAASRRLTEATQDKDEPEQQAAFRRLCNDSRERRNMALGMMNAYLVARFAAQYDPMLPAGAAETDAKPAERALSQANFAQLGEDLLHCFRSCGAAQGALDNGPYASPCDKAPINYFQARLRTQAQANRFKLRGKMGELAEALSGFRSAMSTVYEEGFSAAQAARGVTSRRVSTGSESDLPPH